MKKKWGKNGDVSDLLKLNTTKIFSRYLQNMTSENHRSSTLVWCLKCGFIVSSAKHVLVIKAKILLIVQTENDLKNICVCDKKTKMFHFLLNFKNYIGGTYFLKPALIY